ncbi:MAG: hypothetical protein H0X34_13435 [Chthoniobacterales bacterium]|nr:hypothetical protein [Chthoniobacterales bacterium]
MVDPIRGYLYGNDGKQPGDPSKTALAIIEAIESKEPPLRLLLGADAYGLWEKKRAALDQSLRNGARSESTPPLRGRKFAGSGKREGSIGRARHG